MFSSHRRPEQFVATCKGFGYKRQCLNGADVRPNWFQFSTNSRQIRFDGSWFDSVGHIHDKEAKCIHGWAEGKLMEITEISICSESRSIRVPRRVFQGSTNSKHTRLPEPLQ